MDVVQHSMDDTNPAKYKFFLETSILLILKERPFYYFTWPEKWFEYTTI